MVDFAKGQTEFLEGCVSYSALITFLVIWHASATSLPLGDVIIAQLTAP
jgi:hypothetical protein